MDFLLEPNVAYLMLMAGFWLAIMALLSPGTGFFEVAALFAMVWAGWSILNAEVNWWALAILLGGVFPFLIAARYTRRYIFLAISIVALLVGSAFLIRGESWLPVVDPLLLAVVSPLTAAFYWIVMRNILEAELARPVHDLARLVGEVGQARTDILEEGSVYVDGEMWSARSSKPISSGTKVRVTGREGFTLTVEPLHPDTAGAQQTMNEAAGLPDE